MDPPFGTLRRHFSPGKVDKYFVSLLKYKVYVVKRVSY